MDRGLNNKKGEHGTGEEDSFRRVARKDKGAFELVAVCKSAKGLHRGHGMAA